MSYEKFIDSPASNKCITIEDLRAIPEHAHCSDEELQDMVNTIKEFALLLYRLYEKENSARE